MFLEKYNGLDMPEKTSLVWRYGQLVSEMQDKLYSHCLYQLYDFYVEIKFIRYRYIVEGLCSFAAGSARLDMYTRDVNIADIIFNRRK